MTLELSAADEGKRQKLTRLPFARRAGYLAILILLAVALASMLGVRMLRAASLVYGMTYVSPPRIISIYSRVVSHDPVMTDFWIHGRRQPLEIRMLTPKDSVNAPMIVLVHGFVREGAQDPQINLLAEGLCRSGLRVVMPYIRSEENFRIDPTAVDDVDDVVRWSATSSGQKVSLFGISYSGGPVISAAANPSFADYVKMVFCLSGYNSIDRVGRYYLHDDILGPNSARYVGTPPPNGLTTMALQYLDELVSPTDVKPLGDHLRAILHGTRPPDVPSLNREESVLLDDLLNARTLQMRTRYHAVLMRHRAELGYISPMGKIDKVHGSLYILHGQIDDVIPSVEAEWTWFEALHKQNARIFITSCLHHATIAPHASLREKIRVVYFLSEMLDEALHPVPLTLAKR